MNCILVREVQLTLEQYVFALQGAPSRQILFHLCYPGTARLTSPLPPPLQLIQYENKEDEDLYDDRLLLNE